MTSNTHVQFRRRTSRAYDTLAADKSNPTYVQYLTENHDLYEACVRERGAYFGTRSVPPKTPQLPRGVSLSTSGWNKLEAPRGERLIPCDVCGSYSDAPCSFNGCPRH